MRRLVTRLLRLMLAFALVANGVPALAGVLAVSPSAHEQIAAPARDIDDAAVDLVVGDTPEDCCKDCTPTSAKPTACVAMCLQLPAVMPMVVVGPATMIIAFEDTRSDVVSGRVLAPDPFPPRSHV